MTARRAPPPPAEPDARDRVDVLVLLDLPDTDLLAAAGAWYVPRRQPRYLRRNALLVLGNTGDPLDPRVMFAVRCYLDADDPLLRLHAAWAAARLGRPELAVARQPLETDPQVGHELDRIRRGEVRPNDLVALRQRSGRAGGIGAGVPVPLGRRRR
jgi:hypothetical protein